jgi:hypothetical protein
MPARDSEDCAPKFSQSVFEDYDACSQNSTCVAAAPDTPLMVLVCTVSTYLGLGLARQGAHHFR